MTDIRLRPRFRLELNCHPGTLAEEMHNHLNASADRVRGSVYHTSCVLKMPLSDVQFWSPQLQISIDPDADGQTIVHGQYGPRPAVWSLFIALYVAVGFIGVMGVIFGYSQMLLGNPASAYWAGPIAIVLSILIYVVARQGRRVGYAQMVHLRTFFNEVVETCTAENPHADSRTSS